MEGIIHRAGALARLCSGNSMEASSVRGVDSRSTVPAWDSLSDSRVSFDEGLIRDRRTHTAALEWMFRDLNLKGWTV
ncbi:hypothetical protein J6590_104365, partial [Homalodisca vitripennis]